MCNKVVRVVLASSLGVATVGCSTQMQTGGLIGGAGGAAVGGAIGSDSHANAGGGALIGAAVGAIGGAIIGHALDQQDDAVKARYEQRDRQAEEYKTEAVTKSQVIAWTKRGTSDEVIIDRIQRSSTVFHLTAADENDLRDQNVSDTVIRAMQNTAQR